MLSTHHHTPAVPLERLLPRVDGSHKQASARRSANHWRPR